MQMRAGRAARGADLAENLSAPDLLADLDLDLGHVAVAGHQPVAVVDLDHLAIAAAPACNSHRAAGSGVNGIADLGAEIEAGMHGGPAQERIDPHAESGDDLAVAGDRLAQRNVDKRAGQLLDLGAYNADVVELPIEGAAIRARKCGNERPAKPAFGAFCGGDAARADAEIGKHAAHAL